MWKNLTLRIESELATKLTVVTIAFVGCFGLVTNLMRSTMPISNDLRNVSAAESLRHLPGQNDNYMSKSFRSSDLDSNASYVYAVVVSPDYIDPYNAPDLPTLVNGFETMLQSTSSTNGHSSPYYVQVLSSSDLLMGPGIWDP